MISNILDFMALFSALAAAFLWFRASSVFVRRVNKNEAINSLDMNRVVTAINRTQSLNRRAAFATALSALAVALKLAHGMM